MFSYIKGIVAEVSYDRAVIETGGVGFELMASSNTLKKLLVGSEGKLYTHLYLAEGIMALYGFYDPEEKEMFRKLIGVTRVGPKLALAVLSNLTPNDIAAAIVTENASALSKVPGMGKKTAQRVLLELKENVAAEDMLGIAPKAGDVPGASDFRIDAVAALVSLGYDGLSASRAVTAVKEASTVEELITKALRSLAR